MNDTNIKKILIYCLFTVACFFVSNIKASAYTGTETVNITTSEYWADNYSYTFTDGLSFSQSVFAIQMNYMMQQINLDKASLGASYYLIQEVQPAGSNLQYLVYYYGSSPDIANKTSTNGYMYETSSMNALRIDMSTTIKGSRTFQFPNSTTVGVVLGSLSTSTTGSFNYPIYLLAKDRLNIVMPRTFFAMTDIPASILSNFKFTVTNYGGYPLIKINGTSLTKGQTYAVTNYFDFITVVDTDAPVLDFANITMPQWAWKGDTYVAPIPTAIDNLDGNVTANIQVTSNIDTSIVGLYNVNYYVCDSHSNCTSYDMPVEVKETMKEINMTGKAGVLFYYKDFRDVLSPNAYCESVELNGSCFVQQFDYLGRWKYSKVLLSNLDNLLYENGGIETPLDASTVSYVDWSHINIGHTTSDFTVASEYGLLMYNDSGANTVKLRYNQKYFDYIIYNSLNDTTQKQFTYINSQGSSNGGTDTSLPYTKLEDAAQQGNTDAGGIFQSFTTDTYGLTAIISAPLSLINSLTSKSCNSLELPLPYLSNKSIVLPCMTTVYHDNLGSLFDMYQLITFGIVSYWIIVKMLNMVKDFKNPDHDEIEVLDL